MKALAFWNQFSWAFKNLAARWVPIIMVLWVSMTLSYFVIKNFLAFSTSVWLKQVPFESLWCLLSKNVNFITQIFKLCKLDVSKSRVTYKFYLEKSLYDIMIFFKINLKILTIQAYQIEMYHKSIPTTP